MKKLKSEFYDNFHESMEIVNAGIFASGLLKEVEKNFSEDSVVRPQKRTTIKIVSNVMEAINNGNIYKRSIFSYFTEHSKLKVLRAIYKLSEERRVSIFRFCSLYENHDLIEDYGKNYFKYLSEFNRSLEIMRNIIEGKKEYSSFYSLFPMDTKEDVLECVELLSDYEIYLIFKKYGENLDGDGMFVTEKENNLIRNSIIRKVKYSLKRKRDGYQILGLTDLYSDLSLEEIKSKIDLLSNRQKNYFYRMFGKNLNKKRIVKSKEKLIDDNYKEALDRVINGKNFSTFYSLFPMNTKEEVLLCMEVLYDYEKYLIFKKFGPNLLGNGLCMTPEENRIVITNICSKMNRYLALLRRGYQVFSLTDMYSDLTCQDLKFNIDLLDRKYREYFYRNFGSNLNRKRIVESKDKIISVSAKKALDNVINYKGRKLKPFFLLFESFKRDDESFEEFKSRVIYAIHNLKYKNIIILMHIYGENLDNMVIPSDVTKKELIHFKTSIIRSMNRSLEEKGISRKMIVGE